MTALLLALATVVQIPPAERPCDLCEEAWAYEFIHEETSNALGVFRRAAENGAPSTREWGGYGVFTALLAPAGEHDGDFIREAESALEKALAEEPDHPRWLFAYALLTWKRGLLDEEISAHLEPLFGGFQGPREDLDRELTRRELAGLHAARAAGLDVLGADRRYGITWTRPAGSAVCWLGHAFDCGGAVAAMAAPAHLQRASSAPSKDRGGRLHALERAFDLEPGWSLAARAYLGTLARQGRWVGFQHAASKFRKRGSEPGWALALQAAARWRRGYPEEADSLFDAALREMPAEERMVLRSVASSVSAENEERYLGGDAASREAWSRYLLRVSDPLFLTPLNERRLEHFTRVVLAELWFGGPDERGIHTDRGRILLRYGEPLWVWEVGRPDHLPRTGAEDAGPVDAVSGRRRILWDYGSGRPRFLFERAFRSRTASHGDLSDAEADRLRTVEPSTFDFPVQPMPHQVVRFKGRDTHAEVDYYTVLPADTVSERSPPVETGLFFLPRTLGGPLTDLRRDVWLIPEPLYLTFRAALNQGQYVYTFEALSEDGGLRMADRAILDVEPFPEDRVSVSDVLIARSIEREETDVRHRWDLAIRPAAELSFGLEETLGVYFEVYGLEADSGGSSHYSIDMEVESARGRSILGRIFDGIRGVVVGGSEEGTALQWDRTVPAGQERNPEWFEIDMSWPEPGQYMVTVRVTDRVSGHEATASRELSIGR